MAFARPFLAVDQQRSSPMRRALIAAVVFLSFGAAATAQFPLAYDNTTNDSGFGFFGGASGNQAGSLVGFCDFDDIHFAPGFANGNFAIRDIVWSTFNAN